MSTLVKPTASKSPAMMEAGAPRNVALLIGLSVVLSVLMGTFSGENTTAIIIAFFSAFQVS